MFFFLYSWLTTQPFLPMQIWTQDHQLANGYFEPLPTNLPFSHEARLIQLFFFWLYWIPSTVLKVHGNLKNTSATAGDNEMGNGMRTVEDSKWWIPDMKFILLDL